MDSFPCEHGKLPGTGPAERIYKWEGVGGGGADANV